MNSSRSIAKQTQFPKPTPITKELVKDVSEPLLKKMYTLMLKIRLFEERVGELVSSKEVRTPCHLYIGQEAVATGVCLALKKDDHVFSTHRSHGHYIAKGGDIRKLMAEIHCKATGCSKGKGGSMHIVAPDVGFLGSSAIVGGCIPLAAGVALAATMQNNKRVALTFFGDGAINEGVFYESLNFASLKKLPAIFVCENNFYSTHMPIHKIQADTNIYKKAEIFKMRSSRIDGNNVIEVFKETQKAIEYARAGKGPTLIECLTYRWRGHVGPSWDLDKSIRTKEEVMWWIDNCPIKRLERFLLKKSIMSEKEKSSILKKTKEDIEDAVKFARNSPYPSPGEVLNDVFKI